MIAIIKHSILRFRQSMWRVRNEILKNHEQKREIEKTKRHAADVVKKRTETRLEMGSTKKRADSRWLTIDIAPGADFRWDLVWGLPFHQDTIDLIYASHFFEHFALGDIRKLLRECRRVLKPGGVLSVSVPNARMYAEAYLGMRDIDKSLLWQRAWNNTTRIDYLNYHAYMHGQHKYMFDIENLLFLIEDAGFRNVRNRDFDPCIDPEERKFESIYGIGVK